MLENLLASLNCSSLIWARQLHVCLLDQDWISYNCGWPHTQPLQSLKTCKAIVANVWRTVTDGVLKNPIQFPLPGQQRSQVPVLQKNYSMITPYVLEPICSVCRNYACPLCAESMVDMKGAWEGLDEEIKNTPMPEEYRNYYVTALCRDCHKVHRLHTTSYKIQCCLRK